MVVSYERGIKSLLICVWFTKRFLWPEAEVCVCVCVRLCGYEFEEMAMGVLLVRR